MLMLCLATRCLAAAGLKESCHVQQCEATEALRAALGRMEAALMTRERKLADSWKVLRVHADSLHSGIPNAMESSSLTVSV